MATGSGAGEASGAGGRGGNRRRRVLVVTSDTGAGHRSVSDALIALAQAEPERGLDLVDVDPFVPERTDAGTRRTLADWIVPWYGPVIRRAPWLWGASFRLSDNRAVLRFYLAVFGAALVARLERAIERTQAEAIVSVHPLVNHALTAVRRRGGRPPLPLLTVVTDLVDVHSWWASAEVDQYTVGSDAAAGRLHALGVAPQKVATVGIPLRAAFGTLAVSAREMRRQLGLDQELPAVLLMGGGEGANRLPETVGAFAAVAGGASHAGRPVGAVRLGPERGSRGEEGQGQRFKLVVITGRNARARILLEAQAWPMPVAVLGLVPNVAEHMTAADVVVTKPGSLTVSEALAVGRPLLLGPPVPGQEEGNGAYVVDAGAGLAYRKPAEAAEALAYLLANPAERWEMAQCAARLGRPRATERTLDLLQALLMRADAAGGAVRR